MNAYLVLKVPYEPNLDFQNEMAESFEEEDAMKKAINMSCR